MSRVIKFRAWDKNRGEMLHDGFILCPTSPSWSPFLERSDEYEAKRVENNPIAPRHPVWLADGGDWYGIENLELMQFTGLTDKNGVEIYEGDILQYKYYYATKRWWSKVEEIPEIEEAFRKRKDDFQTLRASVEFRDGAFTFHDMIRWGSKTKSGGTAHFDFEEKWWDFEVVGNICQHKHLIE